jgi:hypothetical protein
VEISPGPRKVAVITHENVGRVKRWRGTRSGIRTFLHALIENEWCQVVETRSDPGCLPPRALRRKVGEYAWNPATRRTVRDAK